MTPQRLWGEVSCECTQMYHYECGSCGGGGGVMLVVMVMIMVVVMMVVIMVNLG